MSDDKPYSGKSIIIKELVAANPKQRLKAVEFGAYGELRRVEWHDEKAEASNTESRPES